MVKGIKINIEKFLLFHRKRIELLEELLEREIHDKLIFQICFLGFESLAKVIYPTKNVKDKFIEFLSNTIEKIRATELYECWRNSLIHQGFIATPWTAMESEMEKDINFIVFLPLEKVRSSVEFPSGSMIAIYKNSIDYVEDYFKEKNIGEIIINNKDLGKWF